MKFLITGGRAWSDRGAIWEALRRMPPGSILVHGACPSGADAIADSIATSLGFEVRRHPADWLNHGKAAGTIRNGDMIKAEHPDKQGRFIEYAIAFPTAASRGTWDCVRKLAEAKIPTEIVRERPL